MMTMMMMVSYCFVVCSWIKKTYWIDLIDFLKWFVTRVLVWERIFCCCCCRLNCYLTMMMQLTSDGIWKSTTTTMRMRTLWTTVMTMTLMSFADCDRSPSSNASTWLAYSGTKFSLASRSNSIVWLFPISRWATNTFWPKTPSPARSAGCWWTRCACCVSWKTCDAFDPLLLLLLLDLLLDHRLCRLCPRQWMSLNRLGSFHLDPDPNPNADFDYSDRWQTLNTIDTNRADRASFSLDHRLPSMHYFSSSSLRRCCHRTEWNRLEIYFLMAPFKKNIFSFFLSLLRRN